MKLLLISSEFPPGPGGIGHHAYALCNALHEKGYDLLVLTVTDYATPEQVRDFDQQQRYTIRRFPRIGWKTYLNRIRMTFKIVRENRFDRILLTGKFSLWLGLFLKLRFSGIKTLAIVHGSEVNPAGRWIRWFTHHSLSLADQIVSVSRFTTSLLPEKVRREKPITIIPNGIDVERLESYQASNSKKLIGHPKLLTVGHVSPRKGQHRVIKALPSLRQRFPTLHYHIVGRPIQKEKLTNLSKSLGVEDMITFHGTAPSHQELSAFYEQSDVFMLLSENQPDGDVEGFGIVALEANFFGLPVVGALYCGVEDAVDHGKTGLLVDGNDIDAISEAVVSCVEDRDNMEQNAKSWSRQHDWNTIVSQFVEVLT